MSELVPHRWITAVVKNSVKSSIKLPHSSSIALVCMVCISLTACESTPIDQPVLESKPVPIAVLPSAQPITRPEILDIVFAQTGLNQLGFKLGQVDGIWGPRSADAMIIFEKTNSLQTAHGKLSPLNLYTLNKVTGIDRSTLVVPAPPQRTGLTAKLDKQTPLSTAPQLVMTDRDYIILAKANPYSDRLGKIQAGSGLYIIQLREGWFEVESRSGVRGFIKAD
jgi:hypothetical protein